MEKAVKIFKITTSSLYPRISRVELNKSRLEQQDITPTFGRYIGEEHPPTRTISEIDRIKSPRLFTLSLSGRVANLKGTHSLP